MISSLGRNQVGFKRFWNKYTVSGKKFPIRIDNTGNKIGIALKSEEYGRFTRMQHSSISMVVRWLVVRQAQVRFPTQHPKEAFPSEQHSNSENSSYLLDTHNACKFKKLNISAYLCLHMN